MVPTIELPRASIQDDLHPLEIKSDKWMSSPLRVPLHTQILSKTVML